MSKFPSFKLNYVTSVQSRKDSGPRLRFRAGSPWSVAWLWGPPGSPPAVPLLLGCSWARSIWAASPLALRGLSCHPNSRWSGNEGSLQYQPGENLIQLAKHRVRKACGLTHVILLGGVGFQETMTNSWAGAGTGQWSIRFSLVSAFLPGSQAWVHFSCIPCQARCDSELNPVAGGLWLAGMLIRCFIRMCHSGQVQLWWHKPPKYQSLNQEKTFFSITQKTS